MQHLSTGHDHAKRPVTFREIRTLLWEVADTRQDEYDSQVQPAPDYEFDQRMA